MKQYVKQNHFIMAVDLREPTATTELANIAYAFRLYTPTKPYERAPVDVIHNLEEEGLPQQDRRWEIEKLQPRRSSTPAEQAKEKSHGNQG